MREIGAVGGVVGDLEMLCGRSANVYYRVSVSVHVIEN